jgi:hypothetical protein
MESSSPGTLPTANIAPYIAADGAQPTTPVLTGGQGYGSDIAAKFVVAGSTIPGVVNQFSLDLGYIDSPNSTSVLVYGIDGQQIGAIPASATGINHIVSNYAGVSSFVVSGSDPSGWTIDNLSYLSPTQLGVIPQGTYPGLDKQGGGSPSEPACNCIAGDPVLLATGDYTEQATDLTVPGSGLPLQFTRTYDATAGYTGKGSIASAGIAPDLGAGWYDNFDMHVSPSTWTNPQSVDASVTVGSFTAISCPSTGFCAATGYNGAAFTWSSGHWSTPEVIDGGASLSSISCTSPSQCWATSTTGDTIEWNGTWWGAPQHPGATTLGPISCPTVSYCWAANSQGQATSWNGTTWSTPSSIDTASVTAISCLSSSNCWAVDSTGNALAWNGTSWSASTLIDSNSNLESISCPDLGECWATDAHGYVVEYTSQNGWTAPQLVDQTSSPAITSVSCTTETACWAVDSDGDGLLWNGTSWSMTSGIDGGRWYLQSISCPTTTTCWAVDASGFGVELTSSAWQTPVELYRLSPQGSELYSVACPSASVCWVGDLNGYAAEWNNGSWSSPILIDPNSDPSGLTLVSMSCPSATMCWALDVGGQLVEWNGSSWSQPSVPGLQDASGVSCPTTTLCWAVDEYGEGSEWNGTSWSAVSTIDASAQFDSVSCPTSTLCWAAGLNGFQGDEDEVWEWNGSTWSSATDIDAAAQGLFGLSCPSSTLCWAGDLSGNVFKWNGTTWGSPANIDGSNWILSISCPTTSQCTSVDRSGNTMAWNGTAWSAPTTIDSSGSLWLACPSVNLCMAVDSNGQAIEQATGETVTEEAGSQVAFNYYPQSATEPPWCPSDSASAIYCPSSPRILAQLTHSGSTWTFTRRTASPITFTFNSSGTLASIADLTGHTIASSSYTGAACPTGDTCTEWSEPTAADALIVAEANVSGSPQIQKVFELSSGLTSTFTESTTACSTTTLANPELCSATDPGSLTSAYHYSQNDQLTTLTPPTGGAITNTYTNAEISSQCVTPSNGTAMLTEFAYTPDGFLPGGSDTTVTTYPNGPGGACSVSGDPLTDASIYRFSNQILVERDNSPGTPNATTTTYLLDPVTLLPLYETDGNGNQTSQQLNSYQTSGSEFTSANSTSQTDGAGNTMIRPGFDGGFSGWCSQATRV